MFGGKFKFSPEEGSYLGVPAVNIGTRQNGRERGKNVLNVGYNSKKLRQLLFQELNQKI